MALSHSSANSSRNLFQAKEEASKAGAQEMMQDHHQQMELDFNLPNLFHVFNDLPDELQIYTLSFFSPQELMRMELVCRTWKEVLLVNSTLWKTVHKNRFGSDQLISGRNIILKPGEKRKHQKYDKILSWRKTCINATR